MNKIVLGVTTNPDKDSDDGTPARLDIREIRPLTSDEYKKFKKACSNLNLINKKLDLFKLVNHNFKDYNVEKTFHFDQYIQNHQMHPAIAENIMLNLNRRVVNYLTAVKTFLDHSRTDLTHEYGKDSQQVKDFDDLTSDKFDSFFAYRFIIKLRNYVQHCGFPLGSVDIGAKQNKNDPSKVIYHMDILINRDEILENFNWKKLKPEIENLPKNFSIEACLEKMNKCIAEITFHLFQNDIDQATESSNYLSNLINETQKYDGMPGIFKLEKITSKGGNMQLEDFPIHTMKVVDYLNKFRSNPLSKI